MIYFTHYRAPPLAGLRRCWSPAACGAYCAVLAVRGKSSAFTSFRQACSQTCRKYVANMSVYQAICIYIHIYTYIYIYIYVLGAPSKLLTFFVVYLLAYWISILLEDFAFKM